MGGIKQVRKLTSFAYGDKKVNKNYSWYRHNFNCNFPNYNKIYFRLGNKEKIKITRDDAAF